MNTVRNGIFKTEIVPDYIYDKTMGKEDFFIRNINNPFSGLKNTYKEEKLKELEVLTRVYNSLRKDDNNTLYHCESLDKMFDDIMKLWDKVVG